MGAVSFWDFFARWRDSEAPADIFKGDAPAGELWESWRRRGWVKEARHYLKLGRNVQCKVCPNNCLLAPGDRSHCRNKINVDGTLYTLAYGNPCTFHIDPVEKKPNRFAGFLALRPGLMAAGGGEVWFESFVYKKP